MTTAIVSDTVRNSSVSAIEELASSRDVADVLADGATSAFRQSRQAICVTDADLDKPGPIIRFVNQAYLDVFRIEESDVLGVSPRFAQGELTNRVVLDRIRSTLTEGRPLRAQAINYRFDRSTFRLRWSIDPVWDGDEVIAFVAMMADVTAEDRLRRRFASLELLTTAGRTIVDRPDDAPGSVLADALATSLGPLIAEIADIRVEIGGDVAAASGGCADTLDGADQLTFPVDELGVVNAFVHPHAGSLFDRPAMTELCGQAAWYAPLRRR